ncbi:hypothetical protein L3V83_03245 [Thiotrichales bacterium 19X7-9]|nr:hypothetical protein [Thiotrichales bacterium 19X7-9]
MTQICAQQLKNAFIELNESRLDYILLRNINNEIPLHLDLGKDIDILVKKKDEPLFIEFFKKHNYKEVVHPLRNDIFLYGTDQFRTFKDQNNILFDLNYQVAVRSLDAGQWIPLDQILQNSAWINRRFEQISDDFGYWSLSYEDELICLVARSIFDKKEFQVGYIKRINELIPMVDWNNVQEKFNLIFFKYTPVLIKLIKKNDYQNIIMNYLKFSEY